MDHRSENAIAEATYRELRRMAASDPRAARTRLLEILNTDRSKLDRFFDLMKPPSEGRVRQLIANTAKAQREDKKIMDLLIPHLLQWQQWEADEFAKAAISSALQGLDVAAYTNINHSRGASTSGNALSTSVLCSEDSVEVYRWVAGRLCHRIRNRMELPVAYLADAIHEAAAIENDVTRTALTKRLIEVQQSFRQVARIVDFDINDEYFQWRLIAIVPWLKRMADRYRTCGLPFQLEVIIDGVDTNFVIESNDLFLEVIFWNLWQNISQEAGGDCTLKVRISSCEGLIKCIISDNGPGFQPTHATEVFRTSISTQGDERGRGLLEVADAVQRLRGTAHLVPISGAYRIELSFPLAKPPRASP